MVSMIITQRRRFVGKPVGGCNITELQYAASDLARGLAVLVACFFFYTQKCWPGMRAPICHISRTEYLVGAWIFLVNSIVAAIKSIHLLLESIEAYRGSQHSESEKASMQQEMWVTVIYVFGDIMFVMGNGLNPITWGATGFLIGSIAFLVGSFVSSLAISMTVPLQDLTLTKLLSVVANGFCMGSAACYIVGSTLYFPQLYSPDAEWNAPDLGTDFYVYGAFFNVLAANLYLQQVLLKYFPTSSASSSDSGTGTGESIPIRHTASCVVGCCEFLVEVLVSLVLAIIFLPYFFCQPPSHGEHPQHRQLADAVKLSAGAFAGYLGHRSNNPEEDTLVQETDDSII